MTLLIEPADTVEVRTPEAGAAATRLNASQLYTPCELDFGAPTTAGLAPPAELPGQERAVEAIRFGVGIRRPGYNLFVLGPHGAGRATVVKALLEEHAAKQQAAPDICYVQNFDDPSHPALLVLPAGTGAALRRDIEQLTEELRSAVPAVFDSDAYRKRRRVIEEELTTRRQRLLEEFRAHCEERGFGFMETPSGFVFVPRHGEKLLDHDEFHALPEEERKRLQAQMEELGEELMESMRQLPRWESEARAKIRALDREMTTDAIAHLMAALRERYRELPAVVTYLDALQRDVIENAGELLQHGDDAAGLIGALEGEEHARVHFVRRYRVNVLVSHADECGAPVVVEENPTQPNLVGQIDYQSRLGALITDFNLIRPGAFHRANGGYLILDARRVLMQPFAWEALKQTLRTSRVRIESVASYLGVTTAATLQPEPMPLETKVVLIGDRLLYLLLSLLDPEFEDLFKVAAEFDDRMDRSAERQLAVARMIAAVAERETLLPFDRGAVARIIEQCSRWSGHASKLSTQVGRLADLLRESDHWARQAERRSVTAGDVDEAVERARRRLALLSERIAEEIGLGTILIDTAGERSGAINALSVFQFGNLLFGRPSRVTASVTPGGGEVVDIEREAKLGGPIHSKGVLILAGFIAGRYAVDFPLSLAARIVFEQSYGEVEGDSASAAELYALLSAISGVPIRQSYAVTGSVNQLGQIQAIGAVNEKIEGFFDVCKARGLDGRQGVIIPRANVQHLMLRRDVVEAARAGRFHIHAVSTVDEGMEVLTGVPAGERDERGEYPPQSLNGRVQGRLAALAHTRRKFRLPLHAEGTDSE